MKNNILIGLLFPIFCFSQGKVLFGKIETGTMLSNVLVVNLSNETETKTNGFGRFSIKAEAGDLIVFSGEYVRRTRFLIEEEHFGKENVIPLEVKEIEIEAVTIEKFDINPEDLGLVPKGQKVYTPAERRLKTATDADLTYFLLIPTLSFSLDPLINSISGRTKMLKKLLEAERFNKNVELTQNYLSDEFLISEFDIPENYTKSFRMFLVENAEFLKVMQTENQSKIISEAFSLVEAFKKDIPQE